MMSKGEPDWLTKARQSGAIIVERRCKPLTTADVVASPVGVERDMLTFTLPWPPTVNTYWRSVIVQGPRGPRVKLLISEKGRWYRSRVATTVNHLGERMAPGRYDVWIEAHPPDRRKRDLDNLFKAVLDSLAHAGVYADDSLIDKLSISRCKQLAGEGMIYVTIKVI